MNWLKYFFFGILASCGALFFELILFVVFSSATSANFSAPSAGQLTALFALSIPLEEVFKFIFLRKKIRQAQADTISQITARGIFFCSLIFGGGFALLESVFNFSLISTEQNTLLLQFFGVILIHIATAGIIGLALFFQKKDSPFAVTKIILPAILLHASYNLLVGLTDKTSLFLVYFALLLGLILLIGRKTIRSNYTHQQLAK